MQSRSPIFADMADLLSDAFSAAQSAGEEARAVFRAQAERIIADMDLVTRDEFDAVKAMAAAARADSEALAERITALEAAQSKSARAGSTRKPGAASSGKKAAKSQG